MVELEVGLRLRVEGFGGLGCKFQGESVEGLRLGVQHGD